MSAGQHRTSRPQHGRGIGDLILTVTALMGGLCLIAAIVCTAFDIRPLVVRSGSMEPEIAVGSLALAREVPADDIHVGDVISVVADGGTRITHRVTSVTTTAAVASAVLQGDANAQPDALPYEFSRADRVFADIPRLGYVVAWLWGPTGRAVALGLIVVAVAIGLAPRSGRGAQRRKRAAGLAVAIVVSSAVTGVSRPLDTAAAFTDQPAATSEGLTTHKVLTPTLPAVSCADVGGVAGLLGYVTVTWNNVNPRYRYRAEIINTSTGLSGGSTVYVDNPGAGSATASSNFSASLLTLGLGERNYDIRIYSTLAASPSWESASYVTVPVKTVSLLIVGLTIRCR